MQLKVYKHWNVLLILMIGIYMRWSALAPMSSMLHYDEAWNWGDAAAIIAQPHFTPFFPGNFGREAGWIYWLALFGSLLGISIFTIRFTATITGILTLAAAYQVGRELFNRQAALWIIAIMAVFYWHVHLSQLALRANLFVLLGTLTLGWLLVAYRTNRASRWLLGGVSLGLLAYTYFASLFWLVLTGVLLLGVMLTDKKRRFGVLLTLGTAFLIVIPMGLYFLNTPALLLDRPTAVATVSSEAILANLNQWRLAWFSQGDTNAAFNLPGRPILGPVTGILGVAGLGSLITVKQFRSKGALIIAYAIMALIPSLLSTYAPHFLRAAGLIVPIALVLGMGVWTLVTVSQKVMPGPSIFLLPLLIIGFIGIQTYQDFNQKWLNHPETFILMEQPITQSLAFLQENTAEITPVYFTPYQTGHPVVRFADELLGERPVRAFVSDQCLVLTDNETDFVSLTLFEPNFANKLGDYATVERIFTDVNQPEEPRFTVFSAHLKAETAVSMQNAVQFDHLFNVSLLSALPETFTPGQSIPITLAISPLRQITMVPSLFVHVYDKPETSTQSLITQADSQLCASYPAHLWRTDETIIQTFTLTLPASMPVGSYQIAFGIYHFPNGARLPISQPTIGTSASDAFVIYEFEITE